MSSKPTWVQQSFALLFIVFCMELGLFLIVYPWTDKWTVNLIPTLLPISRDFWSDGYFRGAVSGIGFANIWIALGEAFRLRRFGGGAPPNQ